MRQGYGMFSTFVEDLFSKRDKAKKEGNSGLSYVYKILMNSLWFGINPRSTITEITDFSRYQELMMLSSFQGAEPLGENSWLVRMIAKLKNTILTQGRLLYKYQPLLLLVHAYTCTPTGMIATIPIPTPLFLASNYQMQ